MTIQFRSRLRSVFDYGKELKHVGKCCFSNNNSSELTFLECFNKGGQFYSDINSPCPQASELGYCCSCTYLSSNEYSTFFAQLPYTNPNNSTFLNPYGIKQNITKCECDRVGGVWTSSTANLSNIERCRKSVTINNAPTIIDARFKTACCNLLINEGFPVGITCTDVCNARECSNLVLVESGSGDVFADSVYFPDRTCSNRLIVGGPVTNCGSSIVTSRMLTSTPAFGDYPYGPCFNLIKSDNIYSYDCSLSTSFQCDGYWIDPATTDSEVEYCNHKYKPKTPLKANGYLNPIQYTESEFNNLNLAIGDEFQGGIYIGMFKPYKPGAGESSSIYGSLNFSQPQSNKIQVSDESTYKKWAIIVNKNFITTNLLYLDDINTTYTSSYYDGYLNCYGDPGRGSAINSKTIKSISGIVRNGFADYYIPSIIEMMFFAEAINNNKSLVDIFELNNIFTSTTFFTDKYSAKTPTNQNTFNGNNFIYALSMQSGKNFAKSSLVSINSRVNLMLFRRLVIT